MPICIKRMVHIDGEKKRKGVNEKKNRVNGNEKAYRERRTKEKIVNIVERERYTETEKEKEKGKEIKD